MFNPKRLSLARQRRGLTKKRLAELIGLSARAITGYEVGQNKPSESTLLKISGSLRFPIDFFALDDPALLSIEDISFRALSRMTAGQRDSAVAAGSLAVELAAWIDERFHLPKPAIPDFRQSGGAGPAMAARASWGLGEKPIRNMVHLLEAHGVRVFSLVEDCDEVDAFSVWTNGVPFVFLNTRKTAERSRWDAAHELGHLILHRHTHYSRQLEIEANEFATNFLMPQSGFIARESRNLNPISFWLEKLIGGFLLWHMRIEATNFPCSPIGDIGGFA